MWICEKKYNTTCKKLFPHYLWNWKRNILLLNYIWFLVPLSILNILCSHSLATNFHFFFHLKFHFWQSPSWCILFTSVLKENHFLPLFNTNWDNNDCLGQSISYILPKSLIFCLKYLKLIYFIIVSFEMHKIQCFMC